MDWDSDNPLTAPARTVWNLTELAPLTEVSMLKPCHPTVVGLSSAGTITWTRSPAATLMGEGIDNRLSSAFVVVVHMPLVSETFVVRSVIVRAGAHVR